MRKQNNVADRGAVGQGYLQPVDANTNSSGRRHAGAKRTNVIFIEDHGLFISALPFGHLIDEALILFMWIIELAKSVRDLHPVYEKLKSLGDPSIIRRSFRKRRNRLWEIDDESRLNQIRFDVSIESIDNVSITDLDARSKFA